MFIYLVTLQSKVYIGFQLNYKDKDNAFNTIYTSAKQHMQTDINHTPTQAKKQ